MSGDGRLTAAVEAELFRRMMEAAVLGQDWELIKATADGLDSKNPRDDYVAGAMMEAAGGAMPHGLWAMLLKDIYALLDDYRMLKQHHGPQAFRAILKAFLDKAEYTRPILDEHERASLGLTAENRTAHTGGMVPVA